MKRSTFLKEALKRVGKDGSALFKKYNTRTHWCLMQVYDFMHDVAGIKEFPYTFSCSGFFATDFCKKRLNHDYKTAEVGDIISFELNGSRADGPDHVGVVIENTGHSLKLLEGNTRGRGSDSDFYNSSTANIFEYSYGNMGCFECIVDMSDFFTDGDEEPVEEKPEEKTEEPTAETTFTYEGRVLKKGMTGKDVKTLQQILFAMGYSVGSSCDDGDFGPKTENAVVAFQKDRNLVKDGIVGAKTFAELWRC